MIIADDECGDYLNIGTEELMKLHGFIHTLIGVHNNTPLLTDIGISEINRIYIQIEKSISRKMAAYIRRI